MNTPAWNIRRYNPDDKKLWNDFVAASRNATFLFSRDYMDYHADRFADHSLIALRNGRVAALLPAHADGDTLCSHRGLSYGGWILPPAHPDMSEYLAMWQAWTDYCRSHGFKAIDYKPLPSIYTRAPSDEDRYALWRFGAQITECSPSATIDLDANPGLDKLRRRNLRAASALPLVIERADSPDDYAHYHRVLSDCLSARHGARPVHTLAEMQLLAGRFPYSPHTTGSISLWVARLDGNIDAGVWLFATARTLHAQYIATTPRGRDNALLTPLFDHLITNARQLFGSGIRYFDSGISTEDHGRIINPGLYRQKASFGATAALTTRYTLPL